MNLGDFLNLYDNLDGEIRIQKLGCAEIIVEDITDSIIEDTKKYGKLLDMEVFSFGFCNNILCVIVRRRH